MTYDPTFKKEDSHEDARPAILHAKKSSNSNLAYPVLTGMFGFEIPAYDSVLLTNGTDGITHVYYVSSGSTVATILITYTTSNISHVYLV